MRGQRNRSAVGAARNGRETARFEASSVRKCACEEGEECECNALSLHTEPSRGVCRRGGRQPAGGEAWVRVPARTCQPAP